MSAGSPIVKEEKDEFDEIADTKSALADSGKKLKQSKINFTKKEKKAPAKSEKSPWSDEDDDDDILDITGNY